RRQGDEHFLKPHQHHRVDRGCIAYSDVGQVARREKHLLVERFVDNQYTLQTKLFQLARQLFRLRRFHRQRLGDDQPVLPDELRQHGFESPAIHLAVDLLTMIARLRREGPATANPDGAADGAGARTPGALLLPRLGAAAAYLCASLLRLGPGTAAGQESRYYLVHQRLVEFGAKRAVGDLDAAAVALHLDLHAQAPLFRALMAGRTSTRPPLCPGTAPLIRMRFRSASTRTTSRFCTVRRTLPMWPDIFLPLNTRPGDWFCPIEPGARCDTELPWVASCMEKLCRLTVPAKPLPIVVPMTSTFCPTSKRSTLISPPISNSPCSPSSRRNSVIRSPASTFAAAKWPAWDFRTREALRVPVATCSAR